MDSTVFKAFDSIKLRYEQYVCNYADSMELVTPKIIRVELDEKQGHQCN